MKRKLIGVILVITSISLLTACGGKAQKDSESEQQNSGQKLSSKDVVSKKDKVVDGKEVTEYTMKDGAKIELPRDINLDDGDIEVIMESTEEINSSNMTNSSEEE